MTTARKTTLALTALLLCTAHAQDATTPAPVPTAPVQVVPATPPAAVPAPVETPPAPAAPAEPAPAMPDPAPAPAPTPAPAPKPAQRATPLVIMLEAPQPALLNGKKTTVPLTRSLTIPADRVTALRQRGVITQSLGEDLNRFLGSLPTAPQDTRFEQVDGQWVAVQHNALNVDAARTRENVLKALKDPVATRVNVAVTVGAPPKRTLDFFASRGITAHLGTGETNYEGSSAARMTNIHVGTRNFKDRLFEGKVFSFNGFIGPISTGSGYVPGLVISGERTASGVGGGICQVSTTAFRALYSAGLKIVERRNHSYQVYYYDPQGLDATIYQPSQDLRFENTTGGSLWFQADWDDKKASLAIHVFGKAQPYTVQIGTPRTLSTTPAPANRLIPDPTLPAGQRKQVDWAAPGAVIEVTRKFLQGGKIVRQDTLKSVYRPWPNIFLIGTKR